MKNELNINVDVNVVVADETAKSCLDILNIYLKNTGIRPRLNIIERHECCRPNYYQVDIKFSTEDLKND